MPVRIEDHFRQATPEEFTAETDRLGPGGVAKMQALLDEATALGSSRLSGGDRYNRLRSVADRFSEAIEPVAACRGLGCSHCCHQAVNITEREAMLIGDYLGRKPAKVAVEVDPRVLLKEMEGDIERYTATPCPMLAQDGSCKIYPVRPLACRLMHSVEDTPDRCDLYAGRHWIKRFNTHSISIVAVVMDIRRSIGDIRDYFPDCNPG